MEGGFTWANSIPLMELLGFVFLTGVIVTKVGALRQDLRDMKKDFEDKIKDVKTDLRKDIKDIEDEGTKFVSEVRRSLTEKISEVKRDLERSAESQGKRIGEVEIEARAAAKAIAVQMELTGRHAAIPREVK
jgi:gas vesicle protein